MSLRWLNKTLSAMILCILPFVSDAQISSIDQLILPQKQSIVVDYVGEGAGASHAIGFIFLDIDTDKDGIPDFKETGASDDLDGDGLVNAVDSDDDNDGIPDVSDTEPGGINSMPASYFQDGNTAASNGNHGGDYWQFVPNKTATSGDMNGFFEHPGTYLYIDNNSNNIPDVFEFSSGSNVIPPGALEKGYTSTNSVSSSSFPGLIGEFEYSGSPGSDAYERTHHTGDILFHIADDDNGSNQTGTYSSYCPYFSSTIKDNLSNVNGNVDYWMYDGTTSSQSMNVPLELSGTDGGGVEYFNYRRFDQIVGDEREVVFFVTTYWNSGGSAANTYFSRADFNPDSPVSSPTNNGGTTGDDFGGSGQNNWYPRLQNTSDHNTLAAGKFGSGTSWTDIATNPTDGTYPVAINPANQDWVDEHQNWVSDVRIIQYMDASEWVNDLSSGAHTLIQNRYSYDLSSSTDNIIIRANGGKQSHFNIYNPSGTDIWIIGVEDLYGGGDRDYDDVVICMTTFSSPKVTHLKSVTYSADECDQDINYRLVVRNMGYTSATSVVVTDGLDSNTDLEVGTVATTQGSVTTGNGSGHTSVSVNVGTLAVGDSAVITFSATVDPSIFPGVTSISNQSTVTGSNFASVSSSDVKGTNHFEATSSDLVNVFDKVDPVISGCPSDITQNVAAGTCGATVAWTAPNATDNCGISSFTSSHTSGSVFPVGETTVTYTAKDAIGNTTLCSFKITVSDNEKPVISACPSDIVLNSDSDKCTAVATWSAPSASDNCGVDSFTSTHNLGDDFPVGETTVTYTAKDAAGNEQTCSFKVTVSDNTKPAIAGCPSDITINTESDKCTGKATWSAPSASDNCGVSSFTSTHDSGDDFPLGETTVTYTAEDAAGNEQTCSFKVTVSDNTKPVITGCPSDITINTESDKCTGKATWTAPNATDNCSMGSFTSSHSSGDDFPLGETTVTYTATDATGNVETCSFKVTVSDATKPVITGCPSEITINSDSDKCTGAATWTAPNVTDNCSMGSFTSSHDSGDDFPVGETTVTYTATDAAGNVETCSFKVTVSDATKPAITSCPSDIVLNSDSDKCTAVATWTASNSSDNCGVASFTSSHNSGDDFPVGETTVTYTATDAAGNAETCSFKVTVTDATKPIITGCPSDITIGTESDRCAGVATWTAPNATDNCGVSSFTSSHNSGDDFPLGETTVTYTATDAAGNVETCSFKVTVSDDTKPVINGCPSDITISSDSDKCTGTATWTAPNATDNCGVSSFTSTHNSGDDFPVGETAVTYTAMDAAGNAETCSFKVTVTDDTKPVITGCPSDITISSDSDKCTGAATWTAPNVTDNCSMGSFTSSHDSGDDFPVGETTVIYTATDAAGNVETCSFKVTVTDDTKPVITACPSDITISSDSDKCTGAATWTAPNATDNCGVSSFTSTHNSGDDFPVGETTVTYTATDAAGNAETCSFKVTVTDDTKPVITGCPSDIAISTDSDKCTGASTWTEPNATDNCGVSSFTSTHNSGDAFPVGETTVTYTATDAAGNVETCSFKVTVTDDTKPVITGCPSDIAISSDSDKCTGVATWTVPNESDNCGVSSFTSTHNSGDTFPVGETTVTYIATDAAGNVETCSFKVTVTDDTKPVITDCPSDIAISSDSDKCTGAATWAVPNATDNCGVSSFTSTHNSGDDFPVGETTVTYTATDAAGNVETCSFKVTVTDDTKPVITGCPSDIAISSDSDKCTGAATWTEPNATDNCGISSFTSTHNSGDAFPVGETTVTYTATDVAGNAETCSFKVTVTDDTKPVITGCPSDIAISTDSDKCTGAATWATPNATDNCGVSSFTSTHNSGDAFPIGETTVTYTATDAAGNIETCSFKVTVTDDTKPVITDCPSDIAISSDSDKCTGAATWTEPNATDNCGISSFTSTYNSGDDFPVGETTVTYTATDAAGNSETCSFKVTVTDDTKPVITACPSDIAISSDSDKCTGAATWAEPNATDNCGISSFTSTHNSGDEFPVGETTVTYTATDAAGNEETCSFKVTVTDDTKPVITDCPSDIAISSDSDKCTGTATWAEPNAIDNCGISSFTSTHNSGDDFPVGETTVTYTATDASGNSETCSFKVTVTDDTKPVITDCPSDIVISSDSDKCTGAATWAEPNATDNCGISSFTSTHNSGDDFSVGETTVTYTATDAAGNSETCSFKVTVTDDTKPVITACPSDIAISSDSDKCTGAATWTEPNATDNCGISSFTSTHNSGDAFPVGETTVTYTATDASGNSETCSFKVTVTDDTKPVITDCPSDIAISSDSDKCTGGATWADPNATDNCGISSFTSTHNSGDDFPVGETTVTYTATDAAGNSETCSFKVTVTDDTKPVITDCPSDIAISSDSDNCTGAATWTEPNAADNCGISSFTSTHSSGDAFPVGETTVTYTATDAAGNTEICSFKVTVTDDTKPVITDCPSDIAISSDPDKCTGVATWAEPNTTDNCGISSFTSTHNSGDAFSVGETTVTYTATDAAGNTEICSFKVTVTDDTKPVITDCPSDITISSDSDKCTGAVTWAEPNATDNCGISSFTSTHNSGEAFSVGETTVTYTATDAAGNVETCSFKVTVTDDTKPVITDCPSDIVISSDSDNCTGATTWIEPNATDNCAMESFTSTHNSGDAFPVGETTVTYTATDAAGNVETCSFKVIVTDDTKPVIVDCSSDIVINNDDGECIGIAAWTDPSASDNCTLESFTSTHNSGDAFSVGETTVTYTATDAAGNIETCSFTITVTDDTKPVITGCPSDIAISADSDKCSAVASWNTPDATDNCILESFTSTHNSGDAFPVGETTVIYTATDAAGNVETCSFTVTVTDDTDPVIHSVSGDITQATDADNCSAIVVWDAPEVSDNCKIISLETSIESGSEFAIGETIVTVTATDSSGNVSDTSFVVKIEDRQLPEFVSAPQDINVATAEGTCSAIVNWDLPQATDNCEVQSLTGDYQPGDEFPLGSTQVTYVVEDVSGNKAYHTFTITVEDEENPVILNCPGTLTADISDEQCEAIVSWDEIEVSDNCSVDTVFTSHASGLPFPLGTTVVTVTVIDKAGNEETCEFSVVVQNPTLDTPELTCPSDTILEKSMGICGADYLPEQPVSNILCSEISIQLLSGTEEGDYFPLGTSTNTYGLFIGTTEVASCTHTVTVNHHVDAGLDISEREFYYRNQPINLSGIEVTSDDNYCEDLRVSLSATYGTLEIPNDLNLSWENGNTNGSAQLDVSGSVEDIQEALKNLVFTRGETLDPADTVHLRLFDDERNPFSDEHILVYRDRNIFEPMNILTPNGDGKNDVWEIMFVEDFVDCSLVIFDEWGKEVYSAAPYNNDWNGTHKGKELPEGNYYFVLKCDGFDIRKGTISLIRSQK